MEFLLEDVAVALLVAVCAVFSAWRLLSPRLRLRVLDLASAVVGKAGNPWIPGLRARTLATDERIVRRNAAIRRDAHDLAIVDGEVLRLVARAEMIAERDEQITELP